MPSIFLQQQITSICYKQKKYGQTFSITTYFLLKQKYIHLTLNITKHFINRKETTSKIKIKIKYFENNM